MCEHKNLRLSRLKLYRNNREYTERNGELTIRCLDCKEKLTLNHLKCVSEIQTVVVDEWVYTPKGGQK